MSHQNLALVPATAPSAEELRREERERINALRTEMATRGAQDMLDEIPMYESFARGKGGQWLLRVSKRNQAASAQRVKDMKKIGLVARKRVTEAAE